MSTTFSQTIDHALTTCADGLDLSDSEDRALFRARLSGRLKLVKYQSIRAEALRRAGVSAHSRSQAVRGIANHYILTEAESTR